MKSKKTVFVVILILAAVVVYIFLAHFYGNNIALSQERNSLTATGTVEAKTVQLAFKVPGKIEKMYVDEGTKVEKGQEVAALEDKELKAKLLQAQGVYEAALKQAEQAEDGVTLTNGTVEASIKQAQAMVDKARIGLTNAHQQYERIKKLHEADAVSDSDYEKAQHAYEAAQNDLMAAEGKLDEALSSRIRVSVSQSQSGAAAAQVKQAEGALMEAETYLCNTHLKSPISGYVTEKLLEEGEMVNAGTPVFEITDVENTFIKVFIDETKIGRVKLNQAAEVRVDAFPDKVFNGKVIWISDAGEFAVHKAVNEQYSHDIRSFEVKIAVPNNDMNLKTGMTAEVKILDDEEN